MDGSPSEESGTMLQKEDRVGSWEEASVGFHLHPMEPTNNSTDRSSLITVDSYGLLDFVGTEITTAKYVRLSDKTEVKTFTDSLASCMGLTEWPLLLISLADNEKSIEVMDQEVRTTLQNFLKRMDGTATETWLLTDGLDRYTTSFIKKIGLNMQHEQTTKFIGFSPWNLLHGKNRLTRRKKSPFDTVKYCTLKRHHLTNRNNKLFHLNTEYSHFYLIDTTVEEEEVEQKSLFDVMKFKMKFLDFLETNKSIQAIAMILMVINGGYNAVLEIYENLFMCEKPTMQVVLLENSGGVSEHLSKMCGVIDDKTDNADKEKKLQKIKDQIKVEFPVQVEKMFNILQQCASEKRSYITIFRHGEESLEETIFKALYQHEKNKNRILVDLTTGNQHSLNYRYFKTLQPSYLNMLMTWKRADIAERAIKEIMQDNTIDFEGKKSVLTHLLVTSLMRQEISFFHLAINMGFDLTKIDCALLSDLYTQVSEENLSTKKTCLMFKQKSNVLLEVQRVLDDLMTVKLVDRYSGDAIRQALKHPLDDLFIWAVLCNKHIVATELWKSSDNAIAKALIARQILCSTSAIYYKKHRNFSGILYRQFLDRAQFFGNQALALLNQCAASSNQNTTDLVKTSVDGYANLNCIQLARLSNFDDFIANQLCIDVVDEVWRGDFPMHDNFLYLRVWFGILFPPLLFFWSYKSLMSIKNSKENNKRGAGQRFINQLRKISLFYGAPITKFYVFSVIMVSFLCIYGYKLLHFITFEGTSIFLNTYGILDVCFAFVMLFAARDLMALTSEHGITFAHKRKRWFSSFWNKVNVICFVTYMIATVFHITSVQHTQKPKTACCFHAVTFFFWMTRVLNIISLHKTIGVYVIMLQRMVQDVIYFIGIALVFIIGYAVSRYSVLHYDEDFLSGNRTWSNLLTVPSYQLLGQFIDSFSETDDVQRIFDIFFTYLYLLITMLLFLNLLIAVFNNTYSDVKENASRIWKWEYYLLVTMYSKFSISQFYVLYAKIKSIVRYYCCCCQKNENEGEPQKHIPALEYFEKNARLFTLRQFEKHCLGLLNFKQAKEKEKQEQEINFDD